MAIKKSPLGRGLGALIPTDFTKAEGSSSISEVPLNQIYPNPDQPRREFDEERLTELADSIREIGIIQPITLRKIKENEYQIIAGERRYRAATIANLETIPAYIRTADDENVMEMALIENIQREDLNAMEVALACQNLIEVYNMTQEQLSTRIGKKRATISNYIRLLKLPAEIQVALKDKIIDMGHARALLAIEDPIKQLTLFHELKKFGYSVRKVEERAGQINAEEETAKKRTSARKSIDLKLTNILGASVCVKCNDKGKGNITIPFKNQTELNRIIELIETIKK